MRALNINDHIETIFILFIFMKRCMLLPSQHQIDDYGNSTFEDINSNVIAVKAICYRDSKKVQRRTNC